MSTDAEAVLGDGLVIETPAELASVARWFRRLLETGLSWHVEVREVRAVPAANTIRLRLGTGKAPRLSGAYDLRVTDGAVDITAADAPGTFYGLQTLRQLLPASGFRAAAGVAAAPVRVAGVEIADYPAFPWRGVMLDVARHFMPKNFVLRLIDLAAMHKCNVLHLHLTDDQGWRMEVKAYPKLTEVGAWRRESPVGHEGNEGFDGRPHGGYYSTEDIRELVAYAAERFVQILPEIDMPGHMQAAIASYPELGNSLEHCEVLTSWGISTHVLNLQPATLKFCTDVLDEVISLFPFDCVHVGGDECPTLEWESSDDARSLMADLGFNSAAELQGWFTEQMAEHVAGRGRRLVCWEEAVTTTRLRNAIVMSWMSEEAGIKAASEGYDVVMVPQDRLYLDWANSDDPSEPIAIRASTGLQSIWSYDPVPARLAPADRPRVLGSQCQLWTEYVETSDQAEYMYFPRLCSFAETLWRGPVSRDTTGLRSFEEFVSRLRRHLLRLDSLGVNYRPLDGPTPGQSRTWLR